MAEESTETSESAADATPEDSSSSSSPSTPQKVRDDQPQRSVDVPMDLYKVVTVFSTFIAIALVVGGMIALDTATGRSRLEPEDVHLPLAVLGLLSIVAGAGVYAFSTRFRAEGMGNPKDGDDED